MELIFGRQRRIQAKQRRIQAKHLWDCGFGRDPSVNALNFKDYLAGIQQTPAELVKDNAELPLLSLCDPRPGLLRSCNLLNIRFGEMGSYIEDSVEPFDDTFPLSSAPFWFRHDDGRKNRDRRPDHCRDELQGDILAGTAMEGIFAHAHHPDIIKEGEHVIDLPRTVLRSERVSCACLGVWDGQVKLYFIRLSDFADPDYGALRLRRK